MWKLKYSIFNTSLTHKKTPHLEKIQICKAIAPIGQVSKSGFFRRFSSWPLPIYSRLEHMMEHKLA